MRRKVRHAPVSPVKVLWERGEWRCVSEGPLLRVFRDVKEIDSRLTTSPHELAIHARLWLSAVGSVIDLEDFSAK